MSPLDRTVARIRRLEPFARRVVAGGLALLAGLWVFDLAAPGSLAWAGGMLLALAGGLAIAAGIRRKVSL